MADANSGKPGYFKYEFIHKGDKNDPLNGQMDVAVKYAGSAAKVYAMRLQTLTGEATYLRCKGCPRHAAEKKVFFEHVKAAAEKKTVHSVTFQRPPHEIRLCRACSAEEGRDARQEQQGAEHRGQLNRPLGHYLG